MCAPTLNYTFRRKPPIEHIYELVHTNKYFLQTFRQTVDMCNGVHNIFRRNQRIIKGKNAKAFNKWYSSE